MHATYGAFDRNLASRNEQLRVKFHTRSLQMKWIHSGLTADLCAAYFAKNFAEGGGAEDDSIVSPEEMSAFVRYAVNELFENALKFHVSGDIVISSGINDRDIIILLSNVAAAEHCASFSEYLSRITSEDPTTLMLAKVEENALGVGQNSGLGFLTLMVDYGVLLGWHLESIDSDRVLVHTMARLSVAKLNNAAAESVGRLRGDEPAAEPAEVD